MTRKHNPLNIKIKLEYLDIPETRTYAAPMSSNQIYANLLQVLASSLAVRFGDVAEKLPSEKKDDLKQRLSDMEKLGLVKVHSRKEGDLTDDSVLSITADGSKQADSLHSRSIASFVGNQLSRI